MSECLEKFSNLIRPWRQIISLPGQSFGATIKNRRAAWGIVSPPRYSTQTTDRMKVQPLTCGRVTPLRYFYSLYLTEHLLCISLSSTHAQSHIKSIPAIIPCQCSFKKKNLLHGLLKHYLGSEHEFEQQDRLEIKDDNIIT